MSRSGTCSVCRHRKAKVHRNRVSGKLICPSCSDRLRLRIDACASCGTRKLLQARGRCFACYKREWRARRVAVVPRLADPSDGILRTA